MAENDDAQIIDDGAMPFEGDIRPLKDEASSDEIIDYDIEREYPKDHPKWFGVGPKGEKPLPGKFFGLVRMPYVLQVFLIIVIEIGIWAIYRKATASYFEGFGTFQMYAFHIVFAPTIHLIPIILFWKYSQRETGLPFVFTKKLLMTGVLIGFMAAIIWRVLEEFSYDALAGAAGGTVPGTFAFWNMLETPTLFAIMTFTHFFIVGPVEELEFRGFTQDQAARVLPNWKAVVFSSVLFGCSHIPIAIFLYQFTAIEFVVALFGWITAGAVFGCLYMWSRNIFACIVMHGMGNWQLSVFYFSSVQLIGGMSGTMTVVVGTVSSIISNAIIILIFYLIHKYYWEPHRRGEPAFGGRFKALQNYFYNHDFERKPLQSTIIQSSVIIVVICAILMGAAAGAGNPNYFTEGFVFAMPVTEESSSDFESLVELEEIQSDSSYLDEGMSEMISLRSEEDKLIMEITITLTWTDEDDIQRVRTWENNPDTFAVTITCLNQTATAEASNVHGQQGTVTTTLTLAESDISPLYDEGSTYEATIEITMVEAGNLLTTGLIGYTDAGNDYTYEIITTNLVPEGTEPAGEETQPTSAICHS
jgi:membrane protease YdiL (CAAX protease family)